MSAHFTPGTIARTAARRPWTTIAVWAVVVVVAGLGAAGIGGVLTNEVEFANNPESRRAFEALEDARGTEPLREFVIVRSPDRTIDAPGYAQFVGSLLGEIRSLQGHVVPEQSTSYFESGFPTLLSADRMTTIVVATLAGDLDESEEHVTALTEVIARYDGESGFEVLTGGTASINLQFTETAESDLATETKALPFALIVLIAVFGAVVAALVPIGIAFVAIVLALAGATAIGQLFSLSIFVTNMIFTIGLAVGIDYALFTVARYREERHGGRDKLDAIETAGRTATRAVMFSGTTVVIALIGMFIVPVSIFRSLAIGAILVVLAAMLTTLTLLPAVLSLLGDAVDRLQVPFLSRRRLAADEHGFWARMAHGVMRRPILTASVSGLALVALTIPYFSIELGAAGAGTLPQDTTVARAFHVLEEDFEVGRLGPVQVVVLAEDVTAAPIRDAASALIAALEADPEFGEPEIEIVGPGTGVVSAPLVVDASSELASATVDRLRDEIVPATFADSGATVLVGGMPALNRDWFGVVDDYTPIVFAFVLGLSFLVLLVTFRSLVVPLKAIVMNLLSVGASYGMLVLIFQEGIGAGVLGFRQVDAIEAWVPLFLFTVLFGLSMDYHVFLLSRIRERFDQTGDNERSVAFGITSTAGIITGAAAIMVVVFAGFALGDLVMFQQMGFGLAFAVLLDATVVRTVLVPATMRLLGTRNWYLPAWLDWLPELRIEEPPEPQRSAPLDRESATTSGLS